MLLCRPVMFFTIMTNLHVCGGAMVHCILVCSRDSHAESPGSILAIFAIFFTYRERVEFSNIFLKFLNGENSGRMQSKRIFHASAFLSHRIQILANSSPKSDIKKKKKKKKPRPCFFAFYGRSGEGNINFFFFGLTISLLVPHEDVLSPVVVVFLYIRCIICEHWQQ